MIQIGRTFSFDLAWGKQPIEPILTGKILVTLNLSGEGGFAVGGAHAAQNHLDTGIITASQLLGVSQHHIIRIEYQLPLATRGLFFEKTEKRLNYLLQRLVRLYI